MGTNTAVTLTLSLDRKRLSASGVFGLRETVDVSLAPLASLPGTYSNWRLYLQQNGATVAQCLTFSAAGVGSLDLNTTTLIGLFAGRGPRSRIRFMAVVWDETNDNLLAQDYVYVYNNLAPDADDDEALPIGSLIAATNLNANTVVRIDGNGQASAVNPQDASDIAASIGVTKEAALAGAAVSVQQHGPVTDSGWTWSPGYPVYLAAAGGLSQSAPVNGQVLRVGVAQSATCLWLTMWPGQNGQQGATGDRGEKGDIGLSGADGVTPSTESVVAAALGELANTFATLSELTDPTITEMVTAINATIAKLKEGA